MASKGNKLYLTDFQSIFYYEWKKNPERSDYNMVVEWIIEGKLDVERLNKAIIRFANDNLLIHSNVSGLFDNDALYWIERNPISLSDNIINYIESPLSNRDIKAISNLPINLEEDLLVNYTLIKEGEQRHRLLMIHAHIITDGSSADELFDNYCEYYKNISCKKSIGIEEQYKKLQDLHSKLRSIKEENIDSIKEFWKRTLEGVSSIDTSFLNNGKKNISQYHNENIKELRFEDNNNKTLRIKQLSKMYGITPYMFSQIIFAVLINKITGNKKFGFSFPVAILEGRELVCGAHVNTLVISFNLDKALSLEALINYIKSYYKNLKTHKAKYLPVTEIIKPIDDKNILDIAFIQTSLREKPIDLGEGLTVTVCDKHHIDLVNSIVFEQEQIGGIIKYRIRYDGQILDEMLVDNFIKLYCNLSDRILVDLLFEYCHKKISDYELGDLIGNFNIDQSVFYKDSYSNNKNIKLLYEQAVVNFKHNEAIFFNGKRVTYKDLNIRANRLADYLISEHAIKPNDYVVLCLDRSDYMIVGILAVIKAGAAYVPVDPLYPSDRISYVCDDTQTKVILTNYSHKEKFAEITQGKDVSIAYIDNSYFEEETLRYCNPEDPEVSLKPEDAAYVIYTSGTTGKPKGVIVEHGNVTRLFSATNEWFKFRESDVWTLFHSYTFDFSVWEIWGALLYGGKLIIPTKEETRDLDMFYNLCLSEGITVLNQTPNAFYQFIDVAIQKDIHLDKLRYVIFGGEALNLIQLKPWFYVYKEGTPSLINMYGITETTVHVTYKVIHESELDCGSLIGVPIPDETIYILDDDKRQLPVGALGELYVGGAGVARGYLNRPELTAERFIENLFQTAKEKELGINSHLYKSGDLVRLLPDGCLEYIGRNDFQVKIRGFRIELGEIESQISSYPGIKQSAVFAKEHSSGSSKYLAAYYVADEKVNEDMLGEHLTDYLPDYMIPSIFIHLEEFPLTLNGKLDRKALPEPEFINTSNYVAPKNDIEKALCGIYADVLGLDQPVVGTADDFFKLGGDSISSIRLVNQIRQKLGVKVTVKDIFSNKTIKLLHSNVILNIESAQSEIDTEQGLLKGESPLLPIQEWFFSNVDEFLFKDRNHYNQSFALKVPSLNKDILEASISKLVEHHDALRFCYTHADSGYKQYYPDNIPEMTLEYYNIKDLPTELLTQKLDEWQKGFDILSGKPLFKICYIDGYGNNEAHLMFFFHHLIIDSVSWRIIKDDLFSIYKGLSEGKKEILGTKTSSYRQWAQAIAHDYNTGKEKEYWENIRSSVKSSNEKLLSFAVESEKTTHLSFKQDETDRLLRSINPKLGTNINDILLSALALSLYKITGLKKNHVLLEGHGREDIFPNMDITNTVGWFTSMYPVTLSIENENIRDIVIDIKENMRKIPNNGIGYGASYGYDNGELPYLTFNYLGQFDANDAKEQEEWSFIHINMGKTFSDKNKDKSIISFNGGVFDGKLQFYISSDLEDNTHTQLVESYRNALCSIIDYLSKENRSYLTSSDINSVISTDYLNEIQSEREVENVYLANSLQQGFIYHSLNLGAVDDAYHVQIAWSYFNELDLPKLKTAWGYAQEKFCALRLHFAWKEELVQIIDKKGHLEWIYNDLSKEEDKEKLISNLISKDRTLPFDLSQGNLFRVYLIKMDNGQYKCIFSSHHAIMDGWSMPVLIKYIHETYINLVHGKAIDISPDNAYGEAQQYLQDNKLLNDEFWRSYVNKVDFQEDLSSLLMPDKRNLVLGEYKHIKEPKELELQITGKQFSDLKALCSDNGFTLNAVLQYCWHKLLSVYGANDTTIVGTTVAGRNLPINDIENSVGLYINTLPVIFEHRSAKVVKLIQELQENINEVNSRSDANLANLQSGGNRLFNSLFVFENYPMEDQDNSGELSLKIEESIEKVDYPLGITAFEQGGKLVIRLQYASEIFDEGMIKQLIDGIDLLLNQLIDYPFINSSELLLLSHDDYTKLVHDWNDTFVEYPSHKTLQGLFEEQVEKTSDNIAVTYKDINLTYRELNEKANRLANYLRSNYEIKPDDLVILCLDRSDKMLIGILAALKTGAAYVPIDAGYPDERIAFIVSDTKAKFILTNEKYAERLNKLIDPDCVGLEVIDGNRTIKNINAYPVHNPETETKGSNLAYIIYTSGTTGQPKGVMTEHRNISRLIYSPNYVSVNENDRILSFSSYLFDGSTYDFWISLLNGALLVLTSKEQTLDIANIDKVINKYGITNFFITTALFNSLSEFESLKLDTLRNVLFGGEQVSVNHVIKFKKNHSHINIIHVYGPTETTTFATYYLSPSLSKLEEGYTLPIGYPLTNTTSYILDKHLLLLPIGATGELYIGGTGVAKGYLNHLELTKNKFIINPYQTKEEKVKGVNSIIYKSGDLVRALPDGSIEYVGRNDFQVKIRGFRIELGEVESQILKYPNIKQALVLAKEYQSGSGKYLIAYYSSKEEISENEMRSYLGKYLPDYMIPTFLVGIKEFKLSITGKIDRRALPEPQMSYNTNHLSPTTQLEREICNIFSQILGCDNDLISVDDSFYKIGGNSILAIKLTNRINKELNLDISFKDIFQNDTVQKIATFIENNSIKKYSTEEIQDYDPERIPLSYAQERLWFIDEYEGGSSAYNIPIIFELKDETNVEILIESIIEIINHHEILRSVVKSIDGIGYQHIICDIDKNKLINKYYFSDENELEERLIETTNYTFNLSQEIPIKINIHHNKLSDKIYISVIIHHIAFDGWSADVFLKNLLNIYNDKHANNKEVIENKVYQYKDFAIWQRQYLTGDILKQQLEYWKNKLNNFETLNLPIDKKRPTYFDYKGANEYFSFSSELSQDIRNASKKVGVSLYSFLLSGYFILLSKYCNQNDIVIGSPFANRHYKNVSETIGFFVNTIPLREYIDSDQKVYAFIEQVANTVQETQLFQDLPFEKLIDELSLEKDSSRHPIFQVLFSVQNFGKEYLNELKDILSIFENKDISNMDIAKFDLSTTISDNGERIEGVMNYASSIFNKETINIYIETYTQIMRSISLITLYDKECLIKEIDWLGGISSNKLLSNINKTNNDYYKPKDITNLFAEIPKIYPYNEAIFFNGKRVTYKDLNIRANRLADYLISEHAIKPNDYVVLCLDRSDYMIVGILAVIKAGAAYVPVDPLYPSDRISYVCDDTQTKVILTNYSHKEKFAEITQGKDVSIAYIDNSYFEEETLRYCNPEDPEVSLKPEDAAYVIYTSGTTGKPKGVIVEHGNVTRLFSATNEWFKFRESDVWTLFHSYTFDFSVWEIWGALLYGGKLIIPTKEETRDLDMFYNLCLSEGITVLNQTPNAFYQFIDVAIQKDIHLDKLRYVIFGGEALNLIQLKPWFYVYKEGTPSLINMYGITETTVHVTYKVIHESELDCGSLIGVPIPDETIYILDDDKRQLPVGALGELYVGGAGVARGYLNRPELTAERFIENLFQTAKEKELGINSHLYKSGDLVRLLPDGCLEYIGRNDFQVKIRGFRIELGEIESQISSYPGIKQSAVFAKEHSSGSSKYLAAYYVADEKVNEDMLGEHLTDYLPDYMIPSIFIHLEEFPLTLNGKLDRKALPEPEFINTSNYVAPKNDIEKALCGIYADVLGLDQPVVGTADDFFKLGGDSISSIRLVNQIRQKLGVKVTVKDIFSNKTIKLLHSNVILNIESAQSEIDTEQGLLKGESPLLPIQEWFFSNVDEFLFKDRNHYNQSFALKVPSLNKDILEASISKLVEHHDALRFCYTHADSGYKQYYPDNIPEMTLEYYNIKDLPTELLTQKLDEWQKGFDILSGKPLFKICYIDGYGNNEAHLMFFFHHLIIDSVSWRIIKDDLFSIYKGLSEGKKEILGTKTSSYRQWAQAIAHDYNTGKEKEYWENIRSSVKSSNEKLLSFAVESEKTTHLSFKQDETDRLLRSINPKLGTNINDILLSALALSLYKITGLKKNHVLLEGHGREDIFPNMDITNTVGWFTSMYPVTLSIENENIRDIVIDIKENMRKIPNNGIGYGASYGYDNGELPYLTFNYLGQFDANDAKEQEEWSFIHINMGKTFSDKNKDKSIISFNGGVFDGKLQFYISSDLEDNTHTQLVESYRNALCSIIDYLSKENRSYLTSSDINSVISTDYLNEIQSEREVENVYLANSLQQGFIYHSLNLGAVDDAYHVQIAWSYFNELDLPKLKTAWGYAQEKFCALRLHFAWKEELVQIIDKKGHLEWIYNDLSKEEDKEKLISNLISKDRTLPFDLSQGNLFRVYLIKMDNGQYKCIFSSHHAIMDGWSMPVLIKYIHETYINLVHGKAIDISPDNAYGEAQQYLQDNKLLNDEFWRSYVNKVDFQEDLSSLLMPDKRNLVLGEYKHIKEPKELELQITGKQFSDLKALCSDNGFTLNAVLQYCWHKLLSVYGANDTTIVGTTVAGRNLPINDIENSVGLYINTLPVIFEHRSAKVVKLIQELQENINEVNSRSDANLANLQSGGNRLFNSLFVFENYPMEDQDNSGELSLKIEESIEKVDYPLGITAFEQGGKLVIRLQYASEIFDEGMIKQLIDGIDLLLNQLIDYPFINSSELLLLSHDDYTKLVHDWNDTFVEYPSHKTLQGLFEEQVEKTSDNIAVTYKDINLTYRELNEKANRLANYLRSNYEIKPDDLVILCLDRSDKMLIGILAALKTGAAYVPIDAGYPDERIAFIVSDTKAKFILTNEKYAERLNKLIDPDCVGLEVIDGNRTIKNINAYPVHNPETETKGSNLAYIIYTSGTTGQPKGVMIEHRSIVNLVLSLPLKYQMSDNEVILFFANYVFDTSIEQIFLPLTKGYRLLVAFRELWENSEYFINVLEKENVTHIDLTPSFLTQFSFESIKSIKRVISGGEAINEQLFNRIKNTHFMFFNSYGLTETGVTSTIGNSEYGINIGNPLDNTTAYILDSNYSLLPKGAIGELYIGGEGIARGYFNNDKMTSQRFIKNPYQTNNHITNNFNSILYKTGDMVRYDKNGIIEYIGRNDFQVKIRGFRIELGEIEAKILAIPDIKQVAVNAKSNGVSNYLIAYYVSDTELHKNQLMESLKKELPDYMIPQLYCRMDSIPLTINGKTNFKELPDINFEEAGNIKIPTTKNEKMIAAILADILKIDFYKINVNENFFTLGGNSILAISFLSKVNKAFGSNCRISDLYDYSSISDFANSIISASFKPLVLFNNSKDYSKNIMMIHPGGAGCEVYSSLCRQLKNKFNCLGMDSYNLYNNDKIIDLRSLAHYYLDELNNSFKTEDTYRFLGWSLGGLIALEMAHILEKRGIQDIHVYLLDTVIYDTKLTEHLSSENGQYHERYFEGLNKYEMDIEAIRNYLDAEESISYQPISGKLKNTKVILYKAKNGDDTISTDANTYIKNLQYNNVDKFVEFSNLTLIELENCCHYDILKHEKIIIENILDC